MLILLTETPQVTVLAEDGITSNTYIINYSFVTGNSVELENKRSVEIYPVPSRGVVSINNARMEGLAYKIYNIRGQELANGEAVIGISRVDLSSLEKGAYFIHLRGKAFKETYKVILE